MHDRCISVAVSELQIKPDNVVKVEELQKNSLAKSKKDDICCVWARCTHTLSVSI